MARIRKSANEEKEKIKLWRTAIYIRLSKEDGNDESYSVKNQRHRLLEHLEKLEEKEEMELVDIYIDDGYTGTDSNRNNFQRLLKDIEAKNVNCVLVKDLSRLSRNYIESGHYLEYYFVKFDVRFISIELPTLDSYKYPEQMNSIVVPMQSVFNENHCRETSIKVRGTLEAKRRKGEFVGPFAPYGYMKNPINKHHLIIDDEVAPVIRDIFHWFVCDGMSKNGIVRKLIGMGIPCPSDYKRQRGFKYFNPVTLNSAPSWSARSISTILSNQVYLGHMVQGKQKVKSYKVHTLISKPKSEWCIVKNTHEAIIDKETFEKAQELMLRDTRTAPRKNILYPFSGFLRCADCNKSMARKKSKDYVYYVCKTHAERGMCTRHSVREDKLKAVILKTIGNQIQLIDKVNNIIEEINKAQISHKNSKCLDKYLNIKKQELKKILVLKPSLYIDWKNGDITREEYHSMKNAFEEKERKLEEDIENLKGEIEDIVKGIKSNNIYFDTFLKYRNIKEIDRGVVVELIEMIHIHKNGDFTVDFHFTDQHRRTLDSIDNNKKKLAILDSVSAE